MAVAGTLTYKTELDTSGVKKSGNTVKSIIAGLGITKMISKAMSSITSSIDDAIARYDTLNNFPKVMSNLGISSKNAEKAIKKMSDKLSGLPTTLDQGAMAVQRFTSRNGDVAKSTDIFLALNNAILAGGASTEIQASALEQMAQAYAKGKPDMMEWRSIMTAMPAQLNQVAEAMGYGKNGADDLGEALRNGDVSMDKFMDTIIELNQKGSKNFKSFEEQARNATDGVNTSIKVAKTQIVKGVANIIQSIDKSLKKSGTSINQIISNLGKKAKKALDGIAKLIEKINFRKIYDVLKKLAPVIATVTTAWIAYHLAIKAVALINIASAILSATKAFISLIPSIKSAKDAMTLLNMTFKTNPIALLVGALGGLVTILALVKSKNKELTESQKEYQEQMEKQQQELEEQTEKIKENKDAWEDLQQSKQNSIDAGMTEISYYESLYDELKNITDENGKVKKGYEDRANFIVGQLNDALGLEMELNDGVIQNYKDIEKKIQDIIDKKKAQIILEAQEESYKEALQKQSEALSELRKVEQQITTERARKAELTKKLENAEKDLQEAQINGTLQEKTLAEARVASIKKEIIASDDRTTQLTKNYNAQKELIQSYVYSIGQYEKNLELSHKGEYQKMSVATWNYVKDYEKAGDAEKAQLEQNIKNTEENLKILKELKEKSGSDIYDSQIKASEKQLKQQQKDLKQYTLTTKEALEKNNLIWRDDLDHQLSLITGKNITFKDAGKGNIEAYINGIKVSEKMSKDQVASLVQKLITKMSEKTTGAEQAGKNLIIGLNQGIANQKAQQNLFGTVSNLGYNLLANLKASLKEQSPSKATKEMGLFLDKGLELGIKDGEKDALNTVDKFSNKLLDKFDVNEELEKMYAEMNNTIKMENAKLNFDVMSNDTYNRTMQLPALIDLTANLESTTPIQLNLDGEKIYENQQKISVRKNLQYGGAK